MFHLTARVVWHDARWDGTVCRAPSCNAYCAALDRVREERNDEAEDAVAGRGWHELAPSQLPACKAESGALLGQHEWRRPFKHPYMNSKKAEATHGHLKETFVHVPPYSAFAVPFAWMLKSEQDAIDARLPEPLPPEQEAPFKSAWVFGRARQEALLDLFFRRLVPDKSLVFFYCKEGQPLGDTISRLVVGVGQIVSIAPPKSYDTEGGRPGYPMWDRPFQHSIRPDGEDGFILPYHDYIEPTGDPDEDARRLELLQEIAVPADPSHIRVFSYAAELAPPDIALATLVRSLEAVRRVRAHGIAKGPWERREEWLNTQIAACWVDRGAFPGFGVALEALGMRLGTALALELSASGAVETDADPWPIADALLRGNREPPQAAYSADLRAVRETWVNLSEERRSLLKLLSRFALTQDQALRLFDPAKRGKATSEPVSDQEILENPYRISEVDLGDRDDSPVSAGMIDRGVMPEGTIAAKHPVPHPSRTESPNDPRRVRAALVSVLRSASDRGDALLSTPDALRRVAELDLSHPCQVGADWPSANAGMLEGVIDPIEVLRDPQTDSRIPALQLADLRSREDRLRRVLSRRAAKVIPPVDVDWKALLLNAITDAGGQFDPENERHNEALEEQAKALRSLTARRLTALVGRAGTGKTSVMGALMLCEPLAASGILLLAPTGKARVRLARAANAEAMTVAQFLHRLGRYDAARQRPLLSGKEKYRSEKTVVIDECSMLTINDLAAVLEALDLAHVQRLILVGDPNQLPPIGVGRPFADLVSFLDTTEDTISDGSPLRDALGRLTVEVRAAAQGELSDTLRLASWFTREQQPVDADRVLSDLELGGSFNDLELLFWKTADELHECLLEAFQRHLGLADAHDLAGFDASLGLDDKGWVRFDAPDGSEAWQILSPVRMQSHGVRDLNRWIQRRFRSKGLEQASHPWGVSLGDETIVAKDKVIQTVNQRRKAYRWNTRDQDQLYIANGEVGLVAKVKGNLKVAFAGRPNLTFDYWRSQFSKGSAPLDLAYALTVHKAQGSEFRNVFVVVPKNCRLLSRELIYTALTRSRERMVLLIEGTEPSILFDLTRPERSETARRNTNLFQGVVRDVDEDTPYAENLIHRTEKGHLVRSKSELVIANMLFQNGIEYDYERVYEGSQEPGRLRPDFSFITPDGDVIVWEHLGMMNRPDYRRGWEWKHQWYLRNGLVDGETLFWSEDDDRGGLDSEELKEIALAIKAECQ